MQKLSSYCFTKISRYPCSPEELYAWHTHPGALQRLLPPWEKSNIIHNSGNINPGSTVKLQIKTKPLGLISITFTAKHTEAERGNFFVDIQEKGPFAHWRHTHLFRPCSQGCELEDRVKYALPLQQIIPFFIIRQIEKKLQAMFTWRTQTLLEDIRLHNKCSKKKLCLLLSGASGVLGKTLVPMLTTGGHEVWRLVRRKADIAQREIYWDPDTGELDLSSSPHFDGVIHLAGEYIGLTRWTEKKKERVLNSRVKGTTLLIDALATREKKPAVFLCASANGYYGENSKIGIDEATSAGSNFIAKVCKEWEQSAKKAEQYGIRTVLLRFGVGLTPQGGALKRILTALPFGYLRSFGNGRQIISWISNDDMVAAIVHCLTHDINGPINIVAPTPVTNREFIRIIAKITKQPRLFSVPAWLLQLLYKEMADEIALASSHLSCQKLIDSGFHFRHPDLETAIRAMLGKAIETTDE